MPENPVISVFGNPIEIFLTSNESNYSACGGIETCRPGGGPPAHKHMYEEETFAVLEGEFDVLQQDRWVRMTPGSFYCSARGTWHGFRNAASEPGRMLVLVNNGGLDDYFEEISALELPRDLERLVEISKPYGYFFQGLE